MAMVCMLTAQNCPSLENNIDYNGNDLTYGIANTINECCNQCSLNVLCNSFTYVVATKICWLKSTIAQNRLPSDGRMKQNYLFNLNK